MLTGPDLLSVGDLEDWITEFPSLSWLASTQAKAIGGLERLMGDVVEDMAAAGESVPEQLSERRFSGTFNVRIGSICIGRW